MISDDIFLCYLFVRCLDPLCVHVCVCVCVCVSRHTYTDCIYVWLISTEPDQQPPPEHEVLSTTALRLYWGPPDYPNGVIKRYVVYRDNVLLVTLDANSMYFTFYNTGIPL